MTDPLTAADLSRLPADFQRAIAETLRDIATGDACRAHGLRSCTFGCDKPKMWQVQAQRVTECDGYTRSTQVPTFSLDGDILGIVSADHAGRIATNVLRPARDEVLHLSILSPDGTFSLRTVGSVAHPTVELCDECSGSRWPFPRHDESCSLSGMGGA